MFFRKKEPPAKVRKCSKCGGTGHDARNCPEKYLNSPHETSLWIKYDSITDDQADKMVNWNKLGRKKFLDDRARSTAVKLNKKGLPNKGRRNLFGGD